MAFQNFYLTDAGIALVAKAQAGGTITFTRASVGDGQLGSNSITSLTALINRLYDISIASSTTSGSTSTVELQFSNSQATAPFYWREIGLWAKGSDGTEVLYAYGNAGGNADYIPSYGTSPTEFVFLMACATGNATSVTVEDPGSIVYAKQSDLDSVAAEIPEAGTDAPLMDGMATAGSSAAYARADHVHATDTSRAAASHTHTSSAITDFASAVLSGVLTGLSTATNAAIAAADTVLSALGKLQAQITANGSAISTLSGAAVLIKKSCADTEITTTSATSVLTWTPPAMGDFTVKTYIRVTAPTTVAVALTYTDASGAQTVTILPSQSVAVGSHMLPEYFFNALSTGPITLSITAGTANQVYASSEIDGNYIYD